LEQFVICGTLVAFGLWLVVPTVPNLNSTITNTKTTKQEQIAG
jgi:hypothetical protein